MTGTISVVFSFIWVVIKPVLIMLLSHITKEVLEIVMAVVIELSKTDFTNMEKRALAFTKIKGYLLAEGKELSDSIINLLIEICYQKLKMEKK